MVLEQQGQLGWCLVLDRLGVRHHHQYKERGSWRRLALTIRRPVMPGDVLRHRIEG